MSDQKEQSETKNIHLFFTESEFKELVQNGLIQLEITLKDEKLETWIESIIQNTLAEETAPA
ncbi:hypothetical protein CEE45_15730 [Candidatus Heimdallarchaeota archaeon B3_Heim]|nr:MAG: hypothetical protein CEE45_15730 [Candidatus Heimdallarchaeota archaeon B3_Heim]